jgi:hypothetical protein
MSLTDLDKFVAKENVKHFRGLLWTTLRPEERSVVQRLLIAEMDKFAPASELICEVEQSIAEGAQRIARQRALVSAMERDGHAALPTARALLATFLDTQRLHVNYRAAVLAKIEQIHL